MTVHSPMRILILDDCDVIADTLCMVLNQSGYEARAVYTHAGAISTARSFQPDVFLTGFVNDCEINGCQTFAEVLTFLPECHVIVFSGTASAAPVLEEYQRRGYKFDVFAKPLHPDDLLAKLRTWGEPVSSPRVRPAMPHSPLRILVLDDCKEIADVVCLILNQNGYEGRPVYTHAAAISAAREFEPDVFITGFVNDCEINGCQTAAEVLTFLPKCHVLIFSGNAAAAPYLEEYHRRGYNFGVLPKPVHPDVLLETMRSYGASVLKPFEPLPVLVPRKPRIFRSLLKRLSRQ